MEYISNITKGMMQFAAVALVVAVSVAMPQTASANTGAGALILNVVTVTYKDSGATTSYAETATSSVTVDLVASAPILSAPADATVASGGTATYAYTVTATANGSDVYPIASTGTTTNATGVTVTPSVTSITLGASVITAAPTASTIEIPAGSETNLIVGDIVVIGGVDYKISAISANNQASHVNTPGDGVAGVTTVEVPVTITLSANAAGSNTAPTLALLTPEIGNVVGEQATFTVDVTATAGPGPGDGTVPVTTTVGTGPNDTPDTTTTTFSGPNISITKKVSIDGGLTFAASGNGAPGDTLTYRITVSNVGVGDATSVVVTDPMPLYTTYTAGTAKSNTTVTTYGDVANTVLTDVVDAPEPYDFTGTTATLNVGTLTGGSTSVLFYKVTID